MTELVTTRFVPVRRPRDWRRLHRLGRSLTDAVALFIGVLAVSVMIRPLADLPTLAACAGVCGVWLVSLAVVDSRDPRFIGTSTEFMRVLRGTSWTAGVIAMVAWLVVPGRVGIELVGTLVLGTATLLGSRLVWKCVLDGARRSGRCSERMLVVGSACSVERVVRDFDRDRARRALIVDTFVVSSQCVGNGADIASDILVAAQRSLADTVLVVEGDMVGPDAVRRLEWALRDRGLDLAVAPPLGEIAAHRVRHRNIGGRPVLHVRPTDSPWVEVFKRGIDIVGSSLMIIVLAPVLVAVAVAVAATSCGPVLFRQERIGRHGRPFRMLKFRSMRVGADEELATLLAETGSGDQPLFKVRHDPRVTRVGRVLRRYSLDELPQLFNVLAGSMSLVGPRPQCAAEVALYDEDADRRLLVKPGMTGLWQVEGRSSLPWEEAIRLDLYYVDNRSTRVDLHILCRTARAVVAPAEDEAH